MNISQSCLDFYVRGRARLLYQLAHAEQVQAYSNEGMLTWAGPAGRNGG